ncbi:MAG: hypothetical protein ACLVCH_11815 [Roseburia inulinivorans]
MKICGRLRRGREGVEPFLSVKLRLFQQSVMKQINDRRLRQITALTPSAAAELAVFDYAAVEELRLARSKSDVLIDMQRIQQMRRIRTCKGQTFLSEP